MLLGGRAAGLPDCLAVGLPGCRAAGLPGCRAVAPPGCRAARLPGCRDAGLLHCDPCPVDADCEGHDPVGSPVLPTAKDGAYGVHYRHESPSSRLVS